MPETVFLSSRPEASKLMIKIIEQFHSEVRLIIDSTAHVGSDTISLVDHFKDAQIKSIEINQDTVNALKHNIIQCGLKNVTVIHDNFLNVLKNNDENIDILYIDAPWGGVDYKKKQSISLYIDDIELSDIIKNYCNCVKFIILKVPKNFELELFQKKLKNFNISVFPYFYKNTVKFQYLAFFNIVVPY